MDVRTSINFAGDIALFKRYEETGVDPFDGVTMPAADYSIGNFEFVQPKDNREKAFFNVEDRFKCSYAYFRILKLDVFDAFGLSNNHIMDYGRQGIEDMVAVFEKKGIAWFGVSGEGEDRPLKFSSQGIKFVVIGGASKGRWSKESVGYGPESADIERIIRLIRESRDKCHHVIVFLHWGTELVDIPPPDNVQHARRMIDAGASAVIGHHPHVPQGIEHYRDGVIAYSLGSFIFLPDDVPGYEEGYPERDLSIVLNIEFTRNAVIAATPAYYRYNPTSLLPEPVSRESVCNYIADIDWNFENARAYSRKVRQVLLKRELRLFAERVRTKPVEALLHYGRYLGVRHFRKLLGR